MCSITFNQSRAQHDRWHCPLYLRVQTLLARNFQNIQYSRVSRLQKTRFIRPRIPNNSPPYSCFSQFLFLSLSLHDFFSFYSFFSSFFFFFFFFFTFFGRFRRYFRLSKIIAVSFNTRCVRVHIHTIHIHRLSIISYEFYEIVQFRRRSRASLSRPPTTKSHGHRLDLLFVERNEKILNRRSIDCETTGWYTRPPIRTWIHDF